MKNIFKIESISTFRCEPLIAEAYARSLPFPLLSFLCIHQTRKEQDYGQTQTIKQQLLLIDRKVEQFLDRVVEADNPVLIETYETKIRTLQEERTALNERIQMCGRPLDTFENTFKTAAFSQPFSLLADLREGNNEMVEVSSETSNQLFKTLENWERNLKY